MKTKKSKERIKTGLQGNVGGCCRSTAVQSTCCEQPTDGSSCCDKKESKEVNAQKTGCC